jgi:hypothetical protein
MKNSIVRNWLDLLRVHVFSPDWTNYSSPSPREAARETAEAKLKSNVSAKTDARFRSKGEKSPGIRA